MLEVRDATSDEDLDAWRQVRLAVLPNERTATLEEIRAMAQPGELHVVAGLDGRLAGSGIVNRSSHAGAFLAPRVLPEARRRGVGTAILARLVEHARTQGYTHGVAHVDGADEAAIAFAARFGFEELDRQVEMVKTVEPGEPEPPAFPGVEFATIEERPELLEASYDLACEGYADLRIVSGEVKVPLEEWLREEATLPGGSFVALADGEVVGYAGLTRWNGHPDWSEHGLTVVRRAWRGRGLATALKQREIAWASANGIRRLVTWTQRGNDALQRVNERLGYVHGSVSVTVRGPLPEGTAAAPRPPRAGVVKKTTK
jgi:GNAT superfamily N-acetyltransferase